MTPRQLRKKISSMISSTPAMPPLDQPTMNDYYYDAAMTAAELVDANELKAQSTINLVVGQTDYLMPSNMLEFVDVRWLNQNNGYYEILHNVELSALSEFRGNVLVYAHAGVYRVAGADYGRTILRLSKAPESAVTGGLVVTYRLKPSRLDAIGDDDQIVDLPENLLKLIPYQVAFYWFSNQGAKPLKDIGANYGQYFNDECQRINRRLGDRRAQDVRREISTDWGGLTL